MSLCIHVVWFTLCVILLNCVAIFNQSALTNSGYGYDYDYDDDDDDCLSKLNNSLPDDHTRWSGCSCSWSLTLSHAYVIYSITFIVFLNIIYIEITRVLLVWKLYYPNVIFVWSGLWTYLFIGYLWNWLTNIEYLLCVWQDECKEPVEFLFMTIFL